MKRIGIDARLYFQTGVGVYTRNFLHYLEELAPLDMQFLVYVLDTDSSKITFKNAQFIKREVSARWHTLAEQITFYFELQKDNVDLMHFMYFSYPVLYKRPFIATIHDVTPLLHKTGKASKLPFFFYDLKHAAFRYVLSQQVKNARKIITPTETVKKQLSEIYGDAIDKKTVTLYEGISYEFIEAVENTSLEPSFKKPYFLYVGNFYPHKNVDALVDAFKQMKGDMELVLAGPDNYFLQRLKKRISLEEIRSIQIFHPSSSGDLKYLYKHALALVNPSVSEGFGLPIIEAAYFNTPIIASNLAVFKELLGDQFISFDPHSVPDIERALQEFLKNKPTYRYDLSRFSFKKMVEDYLELLKKNL